MKTEIIELLKTLRAYALQKGLQVAIEYHEEESALTRFANSAISLNTGEHLVALSFNALDGDKRASYSMITDPSDLPAMEKALDELATMLPYAQPLSYHPSFPSYPRDVVDERSYCKGLAKLSSEDRLAYFNTVAAGLESDDIKLSGLFSSGSTITARISTATEHYQFFRCTDAQITVVLSSESLKWEVNAEQSAQSKRDLKPEALHEDLSLLVEHYRHSPAVQLPLGKYRVVFGPAATATVLEMMGGYAMGGRMYKQGYSFLSEEQIGQRVFSPLFSFEDNPDMKELFGEEADAFGLERKNFEMVTDGVFKGFYWDQDSADEYGEKPTGHHVNHISPNMRVGQKDVSDLKALLAMPRDEDILYIPYIHYMNVVNPTRGLVTGSSRFGALLLKADGSVQVPYNVRMTQAFTDFFGERVEWLSKERYVYSTSHSYGMRNPGAVALPRFMCVRDIEISLSNSSY